ncbi:GlxA family transcriptional regulator [Edaphobacter sp. HDX4]|uniref:GlxA family transcriptional regulator n=1 Tax=Edaphobacter sp. HDX4 TaxID=2794064 RepID=UPI003FA5C806
MIVPGIDDLQKRIPPAIFRALRNASNRGARIASICTGAFVLARSGLLKDLRATTHWMAAGELARRYPEIEVNANVLYVDNGRVLTSAGAAAGMDLCLHMVRCDHGASIAARVARAAVMPLERSGGQAQLIEYELPESNEAMGPLLLWIERNLKHDLPLSTIARHARMSTRALTRRFREQLARFRKGSADRECRESCPGLRSFGDPCLAPLWRVGACRLYSMLSWRMFHRCYNTRPQEADLLCIRPIRN